MKKIIVILILVFGFGTIFALTPTISNATAPQTTIPDTTTVTTTQTQINLDQLIEDIYQQVRSEIYSQVYAELLTMIGSELYDEIYENVLVRLNELVANGEIPVVVDEFQEKIHSVIATSNQSVFGVTTFLGQTAKSLGSSVVYRFDAVENKYYLITNHHVIDGGDNYRVIFEDGSSVVATLLGFDSAADIAILSFSAQGLNQTIVVSPLAPNGQTQAGEIVIAVGNPRGYSFYGSTTLGMISGVNRNVDNDYFVPYIQHDASINSGNSGGPIYNLQGQVVGINVSKYVSDDIEGMGFAIPVELVKRIIALVETNTMPTQTIKSTFGTLRDVAPLRTAQGTITVSSLVISQSLTLTNPVITLPNAITKGLLVQAISASGSLFGTNIAVGDLIVGLNGTAFSSDAEFYRTLYDQFIKGDTVSLTYYVFNPQTLSYQATPQTISIVLK